MPSSWILPWSAIFPRLPHKTQKLTIRYRIGQLRQRAPSDEISHRPDTGFHIGARGGGSALAQDTVLSPGAQQELEAMLARRETEIQKQRADCAGKLVIPIVPNNAEGLVTRYGIDKAKEFDDCMINESGVFWSMGRTLFERKSER
jgi:hypothetical protein